MWLALECCPLDLKVPNQLFYSVYHWTSMSQSTVYNGVSHQSIYTAILDFIGYIFARKFITCGSHSLESFFYSLLLELKVNGCCRKVYAWSSRSIISCSTAYCWTSRFISVVTFLIEMSLFAREVSTNLRFRDHTWKSKVMICTRSVHKSSIAGPYLESKSRYMHERCPQNFDSRSIFGIEKSLFVR